MQPYHTVAFHTLGCKLNFSETSALARQFGEAGFAKVSFDEHADIYVINTCTVTGQASGKCRRAVRRALRQNPEAFVVVTGCYAQLKPQEIAAIPGVRLVLGHNEKFDIVQHLESDEKIVVGEVMENKGFTPSWSLGDRTRSFLKVQDGCDYFCSFCTIPLARGTSRSSTVGETVRYAQEIAAKGVKEVVLTGVNIGDFGKLTGESFLHLIMALDKVEGIERFRISSIEPNLLDNEIIRFVASSQRFMPHFHIPLQSGSDKILKAMRRRYDTALYAGRVATIKRLMPHGCIGVDVIVGLPGESEEDFMATLEFLKDIQPGYLHVFTYSERENTTAIRMDGSVPFETRHERSRLMRQLSAKLRSGFYREHLGKKMNVLWEDFEKDGMMSGFTENYIKVQAPYDAALANTIAPVVLRKINSEGICEIAAPAEALV